MVSLAATLWIVEYTCLVMHHLLSLNRNSHGTMLAKRSFDASGIVFAAFMSRDRLNLGGLICIIFAISFFPSVMILALRKYVVFFKIIHGSYSVSTRATTSRLI